MNQASGYAMQASILGA